MAMFLILPREAPEAFGGLSSDQLRRVLDKYATWGEQLREAGKILGGNKLRDGEGRVLRGRGGNIVVTDGPFGETDEIVGGYWLVEARDYDDVVQLSNDCPHLEFGSLEVRQVEAS